MKKSFISLVTLVFSIAFSAQAQTNKKTLIECPLKINVGLKITKGGSGFQFRDSTNDTLDFGSLSLYDQDPKKNILIKPDNADSKPPHTWTLKSEEQNSADPFATPTDSKSILPWVACTYGKNKEQILVKKLIKTPKSCVLRASKSNNTIFNTLECSN